MKRPFPRVLLAALIGLVAVLISGGFAWWRLNQSGPGLVALSYTEALDRHDLAAANALLSSDSRAWALNTPAEQLGGRCFKPTIAESKVTGTLAIVTLTCTNVARGPRYFVVQEAAGWKIRLGEIR